MTVPIKQEGFLDRLRWTVPEQGPLVPTVTFDDGTELPLLPCLGGQLSVRSLSQLRCTHCGRATRKPFGQGYCYPCFKTLARCDLCIVSPTRCHRAAGTCREPEWADGFCFSAHLVYLANSSGLKVGLTRSGNELGRWADQGARQGLIIAASTTRGAAGELEALIAQRYSDRTDWRKLVRGPAEWIDLTLVRDRLRTELTLLPEGVHWVDADPVELEYPVLSYGPVKSLTFDRQADIHGRLLGVKGQYLLLDSGVFNLGRHRAYACHWQLTPTGGSPWPAVPAPQQTEIF